MSEDILSGSVVTSRKFGRYFAGVADKQNGLNGNRERLSQILAVISGVFRTVAALRDLKGGQTRSSAK
jgi:hypothetical protein